MTSPKNIDYVSYNKYTEKLKSKMAELIRHIFLSCEDIVQSSDTAQ